LCRQTIEAEAAKGNGRGRAGEVRGGRGGEEKEGMEGKEGRDRCLQMASQLRVPDRVVQCSVDVHVPNRPCFKATSYTEGQKPVNCLSSPPSSVRSCKWALLGNYQQPLGLLCLETHATTGL